MNHSHDGWQFVAARSQRDLTAASSRPPAGFADRVLAARRRDSGVLLRREDERLVTWAACLAVAASLLLSLWSWPALQVAWAGEPIVADAGVVDPLAVVDAPWNPVTLWSSEPVR